MIQPLYAVEKYFICWNVSRFQERIMISLLSMETDGLHSNLLNLLKTVNIAQENWKKKFKSLNNPCCFWRGKKKRGAIVCVSNRRQALHFIEQQISTCTVVATSVNSSFESRPVGSSDILSLVCSRSKKWRFSVAFKSNRGPNRVFWTCPTSQWVKLSKSLQLYKPSGREDFCSAQKLACEKACGLALMFCPSYFYFCLLLFGRKEIGVW